jgi:catechol 2,3-dioxygenase
MKHSETPFQLPPATRLGGVRLQVSDLPRSIAYYEQVLGLGLHRSAGDTATLGPRGDHRPLVTLETRPGVRPARRGAFGLFHFALLLPDRAALGRFASHVAALGVPVGTADHLVSEAFYLHDPDGLGIEVYADRPRTTWQRRDGELVMTTDPLDVAGVMAAAQGAPWNGMPPGTVMGHVHLHVGALAGAEAFYHRALGFDRTMWSYPGALFLSAGGYHHHLGTNVWSPGPSPAPDQAQLLEWELVVPSREDVDAVAASLRAAGYAADQRTTEVLTADPWQTPLRVLAAD